MTKLETKTLYKLDVLKGVSKLHLTGLDSALLENQDHISKDIAGDTFALPENVLINQILKK